MGSGVAALSPRELSYPLTCVSMYASLPDLTVYLGNPAASVQGCGVDPAEGRETAGACLELEAALRESGLIPAKFHGQRKWWRA